MEAVQSANLGLRFMLEMVGVGVLGFWGFHLDRGAALKWAVGLGAPLLVIVVWSLLVAPGAENGLSDTTKMWLGSAILAGCAVALAAARHPEIAVAFGVAIVANAILMQVWHQ